MQKADDAFMERSLVATVLGSTTLSARWKAGNPKLSSRPETSVLMTGECWLMLPVTPSLCDPACMLSKGLCSSATILLVGSQNLTYLLLSLCICNA